MDKIEPEKWSDPDPGPGDCGHEPLPSSLPATAEVKAAWDGLWPQEQLVYAAMLGAEDRRRAWREGYAAVYPKEPDPSSAGYWQSVRPRVRVVTEAVKAALVLAKASVPAKLRKVNRATWPALEVLRPKQRRFVRRYLLHYNATRAYKEAYDSSIQDQDAGRRGWAVLNSRAVRLAVEEGSRLMMTPGRVIELTAQIATSNLKDLQPVMDGKTIAEAWAMGAPTEMIREISFHKTGGVKNIKLYDRQRAAELLGKANGAFGTGLEAMQFGEVRFITSKPLPPAAEIFDVTPALPSGEADEASE